MIPVTKAYLPPIDEYYHYLRKIWESGWITNNGQFVQEIECKLKDFLKVKHLFFTNNGTIVLQMALKAYGITKEVITTPFSYVATCNAILWEGCTPVFIDINDRNFCIDAEKIESAITENTQAILATHVYGYPCDIEKIEQIATKHNLKVIYDGAHAFGCEYKNKSLLSYGDISTCSFHATKLFHTVEGGCIITNDDAIADKLMLFRQFGHLGDAYFSMGINAKSSEMHAAMGLCILPKVPDIIKKRKEISEIYDKAFERTLLLRPKGSVSLNYNYSYYPIVFENENKLLKCKDLLERNKIFTRRYFYPSLNLLPFIEKQNCPISENIASRVLCLPLYYELQQKDVIRISNLVIEAY